MTGPSERGVLADERLDAVLAAQGYVVLPLLAPGVVEALVEARARLAPAGDDGLTVDYMRPDRSIMRAVRSLVEPVWEEHLRPVFTDHQLVMATFVVKHPGHESGMFLHEDRSYVEEPGARAHTVWIPLTDVGPTLANGTLEIVPRSHRLASALSGSNTPELFRPYERHLRERLVPLEMAAGSAAIYDTRTLHASRPNLSGAPRVAVVCAVAPRGERLIHVRATSATGRRVHLVTPDFFVEHHPRRIEEAMPPDCPVVREYEDECAIPSPAEVAAAVGGPLPVADPVVPDDLRHPDDPTVLPVLRHRRRRRWPGRTTRLSLAPGERRTFSPVRGRSVEVEVVSGPVLGAGARSGPAAADLTPGRRVRGRRSVPLTVWNDGPGRVALRVRGSRDTGPSRGDS